MENDPALVNPGVPVSPPKSPVQGVPERPEHASSPTKENEPLSPPKAVKEAEPVTAASLSQQGQSSTPVAETGQASREKAQEGNEPAKLFVVEAHHETEEVIERLLDVKGIEQSVTGLWGWMSGGITKVAEQAKTVAETATKVAEKATQQASIVAKEASQQASLVAEKASKARALAEQQAKELAASVTKTMDEAPKSKSPAPFPVANLPWETAHPDRRAEARDRVLKLSLDDQTFTIPPPKEAKYVYDAQQREPYAARMLETDALLAAKRFKLVPKVVDEQEFWRNYFYRVDLILNALGLPSTTASEKNQSNSSPSKADDSSKQNIDREDSRHKDLEDEMRKEIAKAEASHLEDAVKEDENFDMLDDELEFEDDPELENTINDLKL